MATRVKSELIPLNDGIVYLCHIQATSAGGIVLPGGKDGKPIGKAIVVAVGPAVTQVKPGDWIILRREATYDTIDHIVFGDKRWVCKEEDVICKVEETEVPVVMDRFGEMVDPEAQHQGGAPVLVGGDVVEIFGTAVVKDGTRGRVMSLRDDGKVDVAVEGKGALRLGGETLRRVEAT